MFRKTVTIRNNFDIFFYFTVKEDDVVLSDIAWDAVFNLKLILPISFLADKINLIGTGGFGLFIKLFILLILNVLKNQISKFSVLMCLILCDVLII